MQVFQPISSVVRLSATSIHWVSMAHRYLSRTCEATDFGCGLLCSITPAKRSPMHGRLLSIFLIVSVLFGGVLSPAIAHAQGSSFEHAGEVLDVHESASTSVHDSAEEAPDMPGQPAAHHHCTIALEVQAPLVVLPASLRAVPPVPALSRALVSSAQAPPTEPPAA